MSAGVSVDLSGEQAIELLASDLPAHCPNKKMPLWSGHPKVYLEVSAQGTAKCPYCGTLYKINAPNSHGH